VCQVACVEAVCVCVCRRYSECVCEVCVCEVYVVCVRCECELVNVCVRSSVRVRKICMSMCYERQECARVLNKEKCMWRARRANVRVREFGA